MEIRIDVPTLERQHTQSRTLNRHAAESTAILLKQYNKSKAAYTNVHAHPSNTSEHCHTHAFMHAHEHTNTSTSAWKIKTCFNLLFFFCLHFLLLCIATGGGVSVPVRSWREQHGGHHGRRGESAGHGEQDEAVQAGSGAAAGSIHGKLRSRYEGMYLSLKYNDHFDWILIYKWSLCLET